MRDAAPFSKREVARAGRHLAARFREARAGGRSFEVDPTLAADARARDVVEWWREEHADAMLAVYDGVRALAPALRLDEHHELVAVSFRAKRFNSMIEKLTREPGALSDMVDVGGVRSVVGDQEDVDDLHRRIAEAFEVRRVRDWARNPRATGYRALHLHVREAGRMIEVQLRTFGQDAWANVVEEESRLSGVNYKAGQGSPDVLTFFSLVADLLGSIELDESHPDLGAQLYALYPQVKSQLHLPALKNLDL